MSANIYESQGLIDQYLIFHYGSEEGQLPWSFGPKDALNFPQRCIDEGVDASHLPGGKLRGLDIGCGVGRAAYVMSKLCDEVIAIDYSEGFIEAAKQLQMAGSVSVKMVKTGALTERLTLDRPDGEAERIKFMQGNAEQLDEALGEFDIVLAANLLCRLGRPELFLNRLKGLVKRGGQLVITTPNTWLESFTAKAYWVGATPEQGEPLEALKNKLGDDFALDKVWDLPFLIREHERKYQWSVAQGTRWIRK